MCEKEDKREGEEEIRCRKKRGDSRKGTVWGKNKWREERRERGRRAE